MERPKKNFFQWIDPLEALIAGAMLLIALSGIIFLISGLVFFKSPQDTTIRIALGSAMIGMAGGYLSSIRRQYRKEGKYGR